MGVGFRCRHGNYPYTKRYDVGCLYCHTSEMQSNEARKIAKEHINGKFCKQSNQCYKCAYVKRMFRFLRHLSGKCGKRCESCNDNYHARYMIKDISKNIRYLYRILKV